jgi:thioredoxin 1
LGSVKELAASIESLIHSRVPILLEFYADWCAPCQLASPILEELAHEFEGKIRFVRVNVDIDSALVERYEVYSIPTVVIIRDGSEVNRITGAKAKEQYRAAMVGVKQD